MLTKADYERGVAEFQTRFIIACESCKRWELRGALPNPLDIDPERSPVAKRLRSSCKWKAPLPCKFIQRSGVVELTHAQALDAGLCASAPLLRLQGDDGQVVMASRLPDRGPTIAVVSIAEQAKQAFEELAQWGRK